MIFIIFLGTTNANRGAYPMGIRHRDQRSGRRIVPLRSTDILRVLSMVPTSGTLDVNTIHGGDNVPRYLTA